MLQARARDTRRLWDALDNVSNDQGAQASLNPRIRASRPRLVRLELEQLEILAELGLKGV